MSIDKAVIDEGLTALAKSIVSIVADQDCNQAVAMTKTFEQFGDFLKANVADDDTPQSLTSKLNEMMAASGLPLEALLHTPRGRRLVEHLNSLTKKETPMVDIYKLHNPDSVMEVAKSVLAGTSPDVNFHDVLMGHAAIAKRDGETTLKCFNRLYESTPEFWKAYKSAQEAGWVAAAKGTMSLEVVSTETGNTSVTDDSMKAVAQLKELAAQQHKTFEAVMLENPALAARTYTSAHGRSSTSGSELQRR